jgi:hypothetical protein
MNHARVLSRIGALSGVLAGLAAVSLAIPATASASVTSLTTLRQQHVAAQRLRHGQHVLHPLTADGPALAIWG